MVQSVTAEGGAPLIQATPARGGNFLSSEVRNLPLVALNPISLARTLPGAIELPGTFLYGKGPESSFSVNGQRFRGNNYLLDSTENNDIVRTGIAQPFNMADAVEEVSVQTGNFGVEFGRASGGIFNVVTKSGTNSLHGTLLWRFQSQRFDSVSNVDKLNQTRQSVFSHNVYGFTLGRAGAKGQDILLRRLSAGHTPLHGEFSAGPADRNRGGRTALLISFESAAGFISRSSGQFPRYGQSDRVAAWR